MAEPGGCEQFSAGDTFSYRGLQNQLVTWTRDEDGGWWADDERGGPASDDDVTVNMGPGATLTRSHTGQRL